MQAPAAIGPDFALDGVDAKGAMSGQPSFNRPTGASDQPPQTRWPLAAIDPQFIADHENFHRTIADSGLNPAEHQRVSSIIDRVNAYRLGSQQGAVSRDAHQMAAADLGKVAGRLAESSPRLAAPLAAYANVHNEAAWRHADAAASGPSDPYGDLSAQTAPAMRSAIPRSPNDFSSGLQSNRYDELSRLNDLVPNAAGGLARQPALGRGIQLTENQKVQARGPHAVAVTASDHNPNQGAVTGGNPGQGLGRKGQPLRTPPVPLGNSRRGYSAEDARGFAEDIAWKSRWYPWAPVRLTTQHETDLLAQYFRGDRTLNRLTQTEVEEAKRYISIYKNGSDIMIPPLSKPALSKVVYPSQRGRAVGRLTLRWRLPDQP